MQQWLSYHSLFEIVHPNSFLHVCIVKTSSKYGIASWLVLGRVLQVLVAGAGYGSHILNLEPFN